MSVRSDGFYTGYLISEFDELNAIYGMYRKKNVDEQIFFEILNYIVFMWMNGRDSVFQMVGETNGESPNINDVYEDIYQAVGGKDISDRLGEIVGKKYDDVEGSIDNIIRSDGHRCFILGQEYAAKEIQQKGISLKKTWSSVLDGKERETHHHLHGQTKEINEYFETVNGKAKAPGLFGIPDEDCNCRCLLKIERSNE